MLSQANAGTNQSSIVVFHPVGTISGSLAARWGGSNEAPLSWRDLVDDVCEAQGNKYGQPKPGVLFCC